MAARFFYSSKTNALNERVPKSAESSLTTQQLSNNLGMH